MSTTIETRELPHAQAFSVGHETMDSAALLRAVADKFDELGEGATLVSIIFHNEIDWDADHYEESLTVVYEGA